jgi:hypothetical protein
MGRIERHAGDGDAVGVTVHRFAAIGRFHFRPGAVAAQAEDGARRLPARVDTGDEIWRESEEQAGIAVPSD